MLRLAASAVVHGDQFAGGDRLAGEDEVVGFLVWREHAAAELVDGADDKFSHAGSAGTFLAGEGRLKAGIPSCSEQGLIGGDGDFVSFTAQTKVQARVAAGPWLLGGG